jgi:hypothetical protein
VPAGRKLQHDVPAINRTSWNAIAITRDKPVLLAVYFCGWPGPVCLPIKFKMPKGVHRRVERWLESNEARNGARSAKNY